MLIDTHAHLNFNAFKDDADEVIKRSLAASVFMVNVGSQYSTSKRAIEMAHQYETGVWAAVGLHPIQLKARMIEYQDDYELTSEEIKTTGEEFDYVKYLELAKDDKVVAIGEVGLDYHHFEEGDNISELKEKQKEIFLQFIKIGNKLGKPLIIHCWDAYDELYEILKNNPVEKKGIIHSFVGGWKTAKKFTELGYKIGLNGVITYSESYDRLIKELNLEDIVLETDCPYLTPAPDRGKRNEPVYVKIIAEKITREKGIDLQKLVEITTENATKTFGI